MKQLANANIHKQILSIPCERGNTQEMEKQSNKKGKEPHEDVFAHSLIYINNLFSTATLLPLFLNTSFCTMLWKEEDSKNM